VDERLARAGSTPQGGLGVPQAEPKATTIAPCPEGHEGDWEAPSCHAEGRRTLYFTKNDEGMIWLAQQTRCNLYLRESLDIKVRQ
jgi:hypothetical protein